MDSIFRRRSIRNFTDKHISDEDLRKILSAAMCAPSSNNSQPWHFIVVKNKDTMKKIMSVHPYTNMLKTADLAIIVCARSGDPDGRSYWPQDLAASTQNILLEAQELSIGSCWCGVFPHKSMMTSIKDIFSLPKDIHPFNVIALGYPEGMKPANDRYLKDRIHNEIW